MDKHVEFQVCRCLWCRGGMMHPENHHSFTRVHDHILVEGSENPVHKVPMFACDKCGHVQPGLRLVVSDGEVIE